MPATAEYGPSKDWTPARGRVRPFGSRAWTEWRLDSRLAARAQRLLLGSCCKERDSGRVGERVWPLGSGVHILALRLLILYAPRLAIRPRAPANQ
jgi:hypothetical protein